MQKITKTDAISGMDFECLEMSDKSLLVSTPFHGALIMLHDEKMGCYKIPDKYFAYIKTVTMNECAEILGVSKMRVSYLCSRGQLKHAKINGRMVISYDSIINYIHEKEKH